MWSLLARGWTKVCILVLHAIVVFIICVYFLPTLYIGLLRSYFWVMDKWIKEVTDSWQLLTIWSVTIHLWSISISSFLRYLFFLDFQLPHYRGLAWIYWLPPDKRFEPVYPTVKMVLCSPFSKCCHQPIVITIIIITNNDYPSKTNGMWSYFFWMHLNSPPYLRDHTSYARPLYVLWSSWISWKSGALIVRYRQKKECISSVFYWSENPFNCS